MLFSLVLLGACKIFETTIVFIDGLSPLLNRVSQPIQPGNGRNFQRISFPQLLENHSLESFSENWQAFEHRRSCEQRHEHENTIYSVPIVALQQCMLAGFSGTQAAHPNVHTERRAGNGYQFSHASDEKPSMAASLGPVVIKLMFAIVFRIPCLKVKIW